MRDHLPVNIETLMQNTVLFSGLDREATSRIAKDTREIRCDRGGHVFYRGDPCTGFHIVVFGQVKLSFTSARGVEKVVEVAQQGDSFGEAALFLEQPHFVSAQALTDSQLLHVSKPAVLGEMERNPAVRSKMLGILAHRAHQLMLDVEGCTLHSGKQRVIDYLVRQLEEAGQEGDLACIELPVKKYIIASRLNLTQEHFSRILRELGNLGLIRTRGRRLQIPSLERLSKYRFA